MAKLAFYLMGLPRLERDGAPVNINRRRALAFAIYLALTGRAFSREALAAFFWPEQDERSARTDLRRTLHELNRLLGVGWLRVEEEAIQFQAQPSLWIDVVEFRRLLAVCGKHGHAAAAVCPQCLPLLAQAVALYQDDFLAGFSLSDSPAFDDWQFFEGEQLRDEFAGALDRLVQAYTKQANYGQAIVSARRRLALDPLYEPAQRQLIQLYAWHEQPATALRQYEQCVQVLDKELGAPPEPATTELYQAIKARRLPNPPLDPAWVKSATIDPAAATALALPDAEVRIVTVLNVGLTLLDPGDDTAGNAPAHSDLATAPQTLLTLVTQAGTPYAAQVTPLRGGDLLVLFGVAQVHEDDAERAVWMAVAIQQAAQAQGVNLRIGISRGAAYCERTTAGAAATVTGPLVSRATRLRNSAGVEQIWVDQGIYQATRGLCDYQAVALPTAGLSTPVTAYQVRHLRSQAAKVRGIEGLRAELVGRQEEMTKLHAALTQAQQGDGQIVAIVGSAGVGKSRLVEELKLMVDRVWKGAGGREQGARGWEQGAGGWEQGAGGWEQGARGREQGARGWEQGARGWEQGARSRGDAVGHSALRIPHAALLWLEGRALEFASTTSYWLFADLLRGFWGAPDDEHDRRLVQNLLNTLQTLQDAGHLTATDLDEMGPLLGQLLAVRFGTSWDERLQYVDPNQLHQRTFAAMQTLIGALARVQPLVLVFEDLHWADALSVDLITALLEKLATLPLLLLCVYRPEAAQADNRLANVALHRCPERFTELRVRELTPQQSRQLVASLLAIEALPTGLREIILTKAQGNPFFLEEIVRVLIDNGQIYRVGATWQASATLDNFTVPDTLENIILRRLDQLPTAMRQVLQMAAVLGRLFRPALLSRMMLPLPDLESLLRVLSEKNFIYLERTLPEAEYSFHHVLVRDAIYQALPQSQRLVLHRHAGEALESRYATHLTPYIEELAYHYDQADVGAKAIPYLLQAGEKARRTYLNPEAAAYFKRALARLDAQPVTPQTQSWRLTALTGLGRLYQVMSEYDAAEHYLREAIALGPQVALPVAERVRLYYWLGDLLLNWQPRPQAALQLALDGLGLLGDDQTSAEAAMMAAVQAWSYCLLNNMPQFSAIGFRLATFLADAPYAQELRPAYGVVATTYLNNKEITTALHWIDHARRKAAQYQDLHWLAESAYPFTRVFAGQPLAEIMAGQVESLRLFRLIGDRKRVNWNDIETGFASLLYGMLTQAQAALERSLPEVHQINQENLPSVHRLLGEVYHAQGRWTEALTTFQQALDYYRHDSCHPAEALVALAYTHLHAGQCTTAIDAFNEALTAMEGPGFQIAWGHYPTLTRSLFANALCGLEEALADPAAFQAFCAAFRAARPALVDSPFTHWYLMPAQPSLITASNTTVTPFATGVGAPWQWRDPVGNATVCTTTGLQIETPNVRELWDAFLTAPCLLQPVAGDWIAQVVCQRPRPDRPAIGGLLLWQDKWHFLRLDWGTRGQAEVALQGCVNRQEVVIGRGRLPGEQIYLRLERTGDLMQGFCSRDGATWFSVGKVEFAVTAPVQIGLFTGSYIERLIEPGAFAEGTAIRFECFVLGKPP